MNTAQAIAAEVSQYLQSQPLAHADFARHYGSEFETTQRGVAGWADNCGLPTSRP